MSPEEFETIKAGDRLLRDGSTVDGRVFEGIVKKGRRHNYVLTVSKLLSEAPSMPPLNVEWGFNIDSAHLYHFLDISLSPEPGVVQDIPGLMEEKIDWEAHRAFLREHCK